MQPGEILVPQRGPIIIPKYRGESRSFQRAADWLFKTEGGLKLYWERKKEKARREMLEIAKDEAGTQRRSVDGMGQVKLEVSITDWAYWNVLYPGCWQDKTFVAEYHRDNPGARANRPQQKTFSVGSVTA